MGRRRRVDHSGNQRWRTRKGGERRKENSLMMAEKSVFVSSKSILAGVVSILTLFLKKNLSLRSSPTLWKCSTWGWSAPLTRTHPQITDVWSKHELLEKPPMSSLNQQVDDYLLNHRLKLIFMKLCSVSYCWPFSLLFPLWLCFYVLCFVTLSLCADFMSWGFYNCFVSHFRTVFDKMLQR